MNKWAKISIGAAAVFAVAFLALLLMGLHSAGQTPPVDPPRVADYNKPGTVFIETLSDADMTVPNLTIDQQKLIDKLTPMVVSGAIANNNDAIVQAAVNELLTNPQDYIIPGAGSQTKHVQTGMSGTGFIINPDGYLITNAHVVKQTDQELKQSLAQVGLTDIINNDIHDVESSLSITLTADQKQKLQAAEANAYAQSLTMQNVTTHSQMFMGVAVPGVGTVQKGQPLEIVKAGTETPGKDVAIMKVNANNLPTVQLGNDTAIKDGQQALALGYPGAATFNPAIKQSDENVKPSLTVGSVSGRKTMPGGWEVLQMDTAITHGSSGGPLFNSNGDVIGITTFGSPAQNGGGEVQGFNFAVPTTVVKEFLTESNISATEGDLTKTYHKAIDLAAAGHYSAAKDKMKQVADASASYPYVHDMIADYTAKISAGQDSPVFPYPLYLMIVLAVGAVGAIAATGFFLLLPRFGKGGAGAATGPAASPSAKKKAKAEPEPGTITTATAKQVITPAPEAGGLKPAAEAGVEKPAEEKPGLGFAPGFAPPQKAEPEKKAEPEPGPKTGQAEAEPAQEAEEQARFCSSCGHAITPDDKFCPNCAHPLKK